MLPLTYDGGLVRSCCHCRLDSVLYMPSDIPVMRSKLADILPHSNTAGVDVSDVLLSPAKSDGGSLMSPSAGLPTVGLFHEVEAKKGDE